MKKKHEYDPIMTLNFIAVEFQSFQAFPAGMVPYKRPAADKSGVPVYQPNATTYQQLMQLQQPFVPVSFPEAIHSVSSTSQPQQQQQQQQQQLAKESDAISCVTTTAALPVLPPPPAIPDPAALAKEVAQQNYAKAVKLAAVNQSLVANPLGHLNPLNYTGVSLNKQALSVPPPVYPRYPAAAAALPFQFNAPSLNLSLASPYQTAIAQQSLLNIGRPPPNFQFNPYSLMRTPYTAASTAPIYGSSIVGAAQYPVTVSAAPMTNVSASTNIAVAAAQNNNNNMPTLQPYKKLKTT
ncbi:hypothetical protein NQ318_008807 [Aromia moschata]|uniref:Uncharacterized protein n=1 Tax=Aromia moschata TaxID=1265417 RepID=A0AAV8ZBZ1_9CUCU|nr:hypothetical protein NQ318_008807 [Aromia moschata]